MSSAGKKRLVGIPGLQVDVGHSWLCDKATLRACAAEFIGCVLFQIMGGTAADGAIGNGISLAVLGRPSRILYWRCVSNLSTVWPCLSSPMPVLLPPAFPSSPHSLHDRAHLRRSFEPGGEPRALHHGAPPAAEAHLLHTGPGVSVRVESGVCKNEVQEGGRP